jgi:rhodanese-related sulfurtransferase
VLKLLDKNKPVYLYCRGGGRSGKSAKILQEKGYTIYNVLGGYTKWKKEN